jgi:3'(2'), 5'-bisphosphate nucleotidase
LKNIVVNAGEEILDIYHSDDFDTSLKNDSSPITRADLTAHHLLADGLKQLTPNIPVVSEEDKDSLNVPKEHKLYWLIDPLDGTKEFINKSNEFTVNVALINNNQTVYGFVGVPALNTLYWGGKGYGAFKTSLPIVSNTVESIHVSSSKNSTRVFASKSHLNTETKSFIDDISGEVELIQAGSSLKFLRIAEGLADIYPRLAPTCEWDTAAAQAILEGAGGNVTQPDGSPMVYGKLEILNPFFIARG